MHVEICDVSCLIVKTVKTQKQVKYKKKEEGATIRHELPVDGKQETEGRREYAMPHFFCFFFFLSFFLSLLLFL